MTRFHASTAPRRSSLLACALVGIALATVPSAHGQISLSTAVNLALQNSPRVKIAQVDLDRAKAVLSETKQAFVPSVSANAGVGREVGAPLAPPVVFSIGAQSLVFNLSQPDYIRAARSGVTAAQLALDVARTDVSEDTINSYLGLDNTERRRQLELEETAIANRLVDIVADRYAAGVDPHIELTRAKRAAAQIQLQLLQLTDEVEASQEHLGTLTGLPATGWQTVPESIPDIELPSQRNPGVPDDPTKMQGTSAAFANARARLYTARGDHRALLSPSFSFSANYSRISDAFTSYDLYYPGFRQQNPPFGPLNSFNSLSAGVQLTLPILDMIRRSRARESADDAARAMLDAENQQINFVEGRIKLRHNTAELAAREKIAVLDHDLAQDELDAVMTRLRAASGVVGGPQSTPKDEQNARLAERQRDFDLLVAELQLRQAEVSLMRQEGSLSNYLAATVPGATAGAAKGPGAGTPRNTPALPATLGSEPGAATPGSDAPAPVPTTGATPSTLPSAPVTNTTPSTPGNPAQTPAPGTPHN